MVMDYSFSYFRINVISLAKRTKMWVPSYCTPSVIPLPVISPPAIEVHTPTKTASHENEIV
jgi:hypothetical protein